MLQNRRSSMKIADILGTRPEIIKTSPVIRESERQSLDYFILHTGQYYSYKLDKIFFEELELPKPKCNLDVGAGTHAEETGKMPILEKLYLYTGTKDKIIADKNNRNNE